MKQELIYLYNFAKQREDKLRASVFNRGSIKHTGNFDLFEPNNTDLESALRSNEGLDKRGQAGMNNNSRSNNTVINGKPNLDLRSGKQANIVQKNASINNPKISGHNRTPTTGGRRFRTQKISLKPFLPGYIHELKKDHGEDHDDEF